MLETYDLIIRGGTVITGSGIRKADVGIIGEKVAAIEDDLSAAKAKEIVDASNRYVFPGIIDVHVHPVYEDKVGDSSKIAAFGGTTTLIHYAYGRKGESLEEKVGEMMEEGLKTSYTDFGLHGGLFDAPKQVPEIPRVMAMGVRSFKFFLTYVKLAWYTDDYQLLKAFDILAEEGGLACVHCENGGGIDYLEDKYLKGPNASAKYFNATHPPSLEEEGIFRAICLAETVKCPVYIPHVTSARSLRPIRQAVADGLRVYAETCPQYLNLTEDILKSRGALAKIGPPIRTEADRQALWEALADGTLNVVASDHAPKIKDENGDFLAQGFGSPQVETVLPVTYDEGINKGHISLVRLVQVLCENPARIFGLFPRKGTIQIGSDADLVIFNPTQEYLLQDNNQRTNVHYTLYNGRKLLGWPEVVLQRGKKIIAHDQLIGDSGKAKFLPTLETRNEPLKG